MTQREYDKHGTFIIPVDYTQVGLGDVVVARLPMGAHVHAVNVTVDEAFNGTDNKITVGVAGTLNKFQNAFSLAALAGNTSTRQHNVAETTKDIIMSVSGTTATAGMAYITVDFVKPSHYVVEY